MKGHTYLDMYAHALAAPLARDGNGHVQKSGEQVISKVVRAKGQKDQLTLTVVYTASLRAKTGDPLVVVRESPVTHPTSGHDVIP